MTVGLALMNKAKMTKFLTTIGIFCFTVTVSFGALPILIGYSRVTSLAPSPNGGFWVQVDGSQWADWDTGTRAIKGASVYDNVSEPGTIIANGKGGYWVVSKTGTIHSRGNAFDFTECAALYWCTDFPKDPIGIQIIIGGGATPGGTGLWLLGRDGKVYAVGDAVYYGDAYNDPSVATGFAATPSGRGYYIVKEDGGVFSFGDAVFFGSTGGKKPGGSQLTGIALNVGEDLRVNGYWLVAENGGVFTFGAAPFLGNAGINFNQVTSIVSFPLGSFPTQGYAWVHDNGTVAAVYKPSRPLAGPLDPLPDS
jgi:hypothetical protein